MPSAVAPPKNTGGGGFVFEDKVCAFYLACMLADEPPLDAGLGRLERIDFQVRPDGWYLDDALLTLRSGGTRHRCALSIKSNTQFGASTAPPDFVRTAWEQFLHVDSTIFDASADYLGIVTAPLLQDMRSNLLEVQQKAIVNAPVLLAARYPVPHWANETERSIFGSFACPDDLRQGDEIGDEGTGRLLSRLRFLQFDFDWVPSSSENEAIRHCRAALVSGSIEEGGALWGKLLTIALQYRPRAGSLTRATLLDLLRGTHRLKDRPDHDTDWARFLAASQRTMDQIPDTIGGRVRLDRTADVEKIEGVGVGAQGLVLLGPSGVGKSVLAKIVAARRRAESDEKILWFEARAFERADFQSFEADLRLMHPLAELLGDIGDGHATVVLNGMDRLFDPASIAQVATLVGMLDPGRASSPWRVIVPSDSQEWPRLKRSLLQAGVPVGDWDPVPCAPVRMEDLHPVWDAFPSCARLPLDKRLHPLLVKPKVLDLIARRLGQGGEVDTGAWVGESSVASWFWEDEVGRMPGGRTRTRFARLLAEKQADAVRPAVPEDAFEVADLRPLDDLVADHICRLTDERITFEHDLYGDWARLRVLVGADNVASYLMDKDRLSSPLWHRAIRLYGVHLLEGNATVDHWRATLDALGPGAKGTVAQHLLLESVIFAADPSSLLERISGDLMADGGRLLRPLLNRFLHFATVPNRRMVALIQENGGDEARAAVEYRSPDWPYWLPMVRFLHAHRREVVPVAPVEIARIVRLWLDQTPDNWPVRGEAAALGLMLGERGLDASEDRHHPDHEDRRQLYLAALAGARERPGDVSDFALRAGMRRGVPSRDDDRRPDPALLPRTITADPRYNPDEPVPPPWPGGPFARVDDEFRAAILADHGLNALIGARPDAARDVALAVLIKERHRYAWRHDWFAAHALELDDSHFRPPPLYLDGPFLRFLEVRFDEALDLIAHIVDFAIERWVQYLEERRDEMPGDGADSDKTGGGLEDEMRRTLRPPGGVTLALEDGERTLLGDERVYGWSAGLSVSPSAVEVALMALEEFFYRRIDAGAPVDGYARAVLGRARNVAFLKVLCDVGRRAPDIFEGSLQPLLASPEIHQWDIHARVQGRRHLMMGASLRGDWFVREAEAFHAHEHRNIDLRWLALDMLLKRPGMRPAFGRVRQGWERRLVGEPDAEMRGLLEQLIVTLDPANYRVQEESGRYVLMNARAQELQDARADERRQFEDRTLPYLFAVRCRTLLDEGKALEPGELGPFWEHLRRAHDIGERTRNQGAQGDVMWQSSEKIAGAVCGGIAVLLRYHEGWLAAHEDRATWCMERLVATVLNPPPQEHISAPEDVSDLTWDCFAAETIPALWAQNPDSPDLRALVAILVLVYRYLTVRTLFARCAEHRAALGGDFIRLRRLLFEWAHVRARRSNVRHWGAFADIPHAELVARVDQATRRWATGRIADFVEKRVPAELLLWREMDVPASFKDVDDSLPVWRREEYPVDFQLILVAHDWLPLLDRAHSRAERADWIDFWQQALAHALRRTTLHADGRKRDESMYPNQDELTVLRGIATTVLYMEPDERPDAFWLPIMDLQRDADDWGDDWASDWVGEFLQALHGRALRSDPVPAGYVPAVRMLFEFAASTTAGGSNERSVWRHRGDHWLALLGLDRYTRDAWGRSRRPIVAAMEDLFDRWAAHNLTYGRWMAPFALFLAHPAADPILLKGIIWIERAVAAAGGRVFDDGQAVDATASLLNVLWANHQQRVQRDSTAFAAFRATLHALVERQHPLALDIQGRIGGL